MMPVHQSTLALSVYNALLLAGSMTPVQVLAHLRAHWAPQMVQTEVDLGVAYLKKRRLVVCAAGVLHAQNVRDGVARPLKRTAKQPTELVLA